MQYNIFINQKALVDSGLIDKLDAVDLIIFDFIYNFFNCNLKEKVTFIKEGVEYTELSVSMIKEELPLAKINSRSGLYNRINKLVGAGLIDRYESNPTENRCGYKKGKNWSIFQFITPVHENGQGVHENGQGVHENGQGVHENGHNHNIPYREIKNINNNTLSLKEKDSDILRISSSKKKDCESAEGETESTPSNSPFIPPTPLSSSPYPPTFEQIWEMYDKQVGNVRELKFQYDQLGYFEKLKIAEHIPKYKQAQPDKQFRKDFKNYLNDRTWNDEIIPRTTNGKVKKKYGNTAPDDFKGRGYSDI